MASPWKFLARLTLRRREQTDQKGATDDQQSEQAVISESVEAAGEKALNAPDRRTDADAQSADHSDAVSAKPKHSEEAISTSEVATDRVSAKPADVGDLPLSDDRDIAYRIVPDVQTPLQASQSAPRTRSRKGSSADRAVVARQPPPRAPTFPEAVVSLDEEIRVLREHLSRKLQLQNAQLRRMLERFER